MFGRNAKRLRSVFDAGLLQTFGKLSQPDIDKIDGQLEKLIAELVEQYGWDQDFARQKADRFERKLSIRPAMRIRQFPAGVVLPPAEMPATLTRYLRSNPISPPPHLRR